MPEGLNERDHLAVVKHRNRAAQIRQMTDAALGEVGVVHQKHVAGPHGRDRKIAHDRVRHRGIRAAGKLAAMTVEQPDPVIMRFADHGAARRALDRVLDLGFDGIQRTLDDLQHDGINGGCRGAWQARL